MSVVNFPSSHGEKLWSMIVSFARRLAMLDIIGVLLQHADNDPDFLELPIIKDTIDVHVDVTKDYEVENL